MEMCLRLVIAENRPLLFKIWSEVFSHVQSVTILNGTAHALFESQKIDAELMRSIFAHERYGGKQKVGESQILSTKGESGMAPWVVTTAPFPAHIERWQQSNSSFEMRIVQDNEISPEEESYILFKKAFERIKIFNQENKTQQIKALGIDLQFLDFPFQDAQRESKLALKAYSEFYNERCTLR
jgi:hypothetical protein